MTSHFHNKLIEQIAMLTDLPKGAAEYAEWIKAGEHLRFLQDTANDDEVVIYACGDYTFIHTVAVSDDRLSPLDQDDLLGWAGNPYSLRAGYVWGGRGDDVGIERGGSISGSNTLKDASQLLFAREIEGSTGSVQVYFEILQEYSHLSSVHWRPEQRAYCRFDEHGNWEQVVSVTTREQQEGVTLVSFKREDLEQYLAVSNSVLIRMFDFTLFRRPEFTGWSDAPEHVVRKSDNLFYRQKVDAGKAGYTRGVQILRPIRPRNKILSSITGGRTERTDRQYCEFVGRDWRNGLVTTISTHPAATTNYFNASSNSLPYELSPAFFRPEVLLKYKADRDKYTISEENRYIYCRGGWELRNYDINEAGQVFAYICYLRSLPYQEQWYWKSFNEDPKSGISERALLNDFKGQWAAISDPVVEILSVLRRWRRLDTAWWKLREETLLDRVNVPRTGSRDEWAQSFSDLAKLVIEGFEIKAIRARLDEMGVGFNEDDGSLNLIEKVLAQSGAPASDERLKLNGLRTVQKIRSKIASHHRGRGGAALERDALLKHGTHSAHFDNVCSVVIDELKAIEEALS